jgi:hypothetical protein
LAFLLATNCWEWLASTLGLAMEKVVSQILCDFASKGRGDCAPTELHNSQHTAGKKGCHKNS